MIRIAVVDDEPYIANRIAERTKHHAQVLDIPVKITVFYSGNAFLAVFHPGQYDAAFLDIDMPGLRGDALSTYLKKLDPILLLVYVSNYYKQEVYTMMRFTPISYVRKPYFEDDIDIALTELYHNLTRVQIYYPLQIGHSVREVAIAQIQYIESERNYVYFYVQSLHPTDDENPIECIRVRKKLNQVEEDLASHGFIRIHVSYLVNYRYIFSIQDKQVLLDSGKRLPISRSHEADVSHKLLYFSRRT